jgi:hypothetical protein
MGKRSSRNLLILFSQLVRNGDKHDELYESLRPHGVTNVVRRSTCWVPFNKLNKGVPKDMRSEVEWHPATGADFLRNPFRRSK